MKTSEATAEVRATATRLHADETRVFYHEVEIATTRPDGTRGITYGELVADKADPQAAAEQVLQAVACHLGPGRFRITREDR